MFDDLLLLKKGGNTVFFGALGPECIHLIDYFEDRGANPIQFGENPAAWMLRAQTAGAAADVDWAQAFKESDDYRNLNEKLEKVGELLDDTKKLHFAEAYPTTGKERMALMNQRVVTIYKRSPAYNLARLSIAVLYAFIIGSVFLRGDGRREYWLENEVDAVISTMFFSLIVIGVTSISMAVPVTKTLRGRLLHSGVCYLPLIQNEESNKRLFSRCLLQAPCVWNAYTQGSIFGSFCW